jgi:hypothetical protein
MRKEFADGTCRLRRLPGENVFHIGVGIISIKLGRMNQAHHGRCSLTGAQAACEQPIVSSDSHWPDLVLDPIIIDRHTPIFKVARERNPASQAVIDRFCGRAAFRHKLPLFQQSGVQRIGGGPCLSMT